ncbi:Uncaracterized surface protein containing fasciclin (FAS1) repeats [Palleronia salina]|uniref:Uncaracterized surface protein containing fasciclin (FAS1) repeats n=1 Tax=Palleronia salina TaxID=313368 RepID=A0A1M6M8I5_9RHOB|nr:fasciclin domain-containing protein [Palleronia salina]SHJ79593.1 Uncaracterized surface protein containing fasciclin (FAS1) repeats [Palleronia salina]
MNKITLTTCAALLAAGTATAQDNPTVGGAEMFPEKTIAANASNAPNLTTLVTAVTEAGLVDTLNGPGPFTVFAPTNRAFERITDESLNALLANEQQLRQVLTCHVVAANADANAIVGMIADDNGAHPVPTVGGCTLTATLEGDTVVLTDENGREARVIQSDVTQSNGVVHVIDRVLLPAGQAAM